jgi:murein DD-endopeptidase MepM/ murein hydrolase activator NlpD
MFLSLPTLYFSETASWAAKEPFYAAPVTPSGQTLFLRSDSFGKGFFSANRNGGRRHKGIDLKTPLGQPIFASKSGRVTVADFDKGGYGNYLEISHPDGLRTRYAHLAAMRVQKGQWVQMGQIVGLCGRTGNADDARIIPHLHFEIRYQNHALNPTDQLLDPVLKIVQ